MVSIDASLQADLLRIVQEACSNAVRHGEARHIWIEAALVHGWLDLQVRDDGHGFDPQSSNLVAPERKSGRSSPSQSATRGGVGLSSMSERASSHRGTLQVHSALGRGTTARVRIPVTGGRRAAS
jgi:NarL family two-component system sensor histidine kinase YdfH